MTATEQGGSGMDRPGANGLREGAAAFLGQVLGMADQAATLTGDLSPIKQDVNAAVYTIQLDSTVGPAAFLVYAYVLDDRGGDGHTGKELFDAGLETLQQAARRASPGPRAVAHGETAAFGFILATTPGTYRALAGEDEAAGTDAASASDAGVAVIDADEARGDAAERLLQTLRVANAEASEWLAAVGASIGEDPDQRVDEPLAFDERETELALFLLDNASIGDLLQALNLIVSTAQRQAMTVLDDEQDAGERRR